MTVTETALLKVKTISKKMAEQIQHVPYKRGGKDQPTLWDRIHQALEAEEVKPIGWVPPVVLDSNYPLGFWLIHFENRYWWWMCPNHGATWEKYAQIDQLFI